MYEVDGIRGIALTLVVLFHVFGHGRVSGGVDVFLVISAYFLTRKLLSRFEDSSSENHPAAQQAGWLGRHYAGVLSRLVPSVAIVLLGVVVASRLFARPSQYLQNLREIVASALYYENWELIGSQLAYEAAGPDTSPLQHFWSLSVQGQFFLLWPLLGFGVFFLALRHRTSYRTVFLGVIATLTAASFGYALFLVSHDQQVAYFNSFARFWELGAGALIAFVPTRFLARGWAKELGVWAGIGMIVLSGFLFDGASLFPGVQTLWPVSGTLIALFAASRATPPGLSARVLGAPAVQYLSAISYQLYLWHWPVLVFYIQVRGWDRVGPLGALVVLGSSFALAAATQWLVSRSWITPGRGSFRWRSVLVPALSICLVLGVTGLWRIQIDRQQQQAIELEKERAAAYIGALAHTDPELARTIPSDIPPKPAPDAAYRDRPSIYKEGCVQSVRDEPGMGEVLVCDVDDYGDAATVVLTGGSHAVQWYPAVRAIAEEQSWRLLVIDKDGCRLTTEAKLTTCAEWNEQAVDVIASYQPDFILTLGSVAYARPGELDRINPDTVEVWEEFDELGIPVIGIRDTPRLPFKVPDCLLDNPGATEACRHPLSDVYSSDVLGSVEELPGLFTLIDLSAVVNGPEYFEPVVGNVVTYRDHAHLTATYAATIAPMLSEAIRAELPEFFAQ